MQLAPTLSNPGSIWSAAAWIGITRSTSDQTQWVDGTGAVQSNIPWCAGEPNLRYTTEQCVNLLTGCTPGGGIASANDYSCDQPLRVLCSFTSSACGGKQQHGMAAAAVGAAGARQLVCEAAVQLEAL